MADIVMARIMTVVALVIEDEVIVIHQQLPKRKIGVGRKAVAVREDKPWTIGIAMSTETNNRPIRHRKVYGF